MRELPLETPLFEALGARAPLLRPLEKLGLKTVRDLLFYFPVRYEDFTRMAEIAELTPGQQVTIQAAIEDVRSFRTRRGLTVVEAVIADESASMKAVWFNQPYVTNTLHPGRIANFSGKVSSSDEKGLYLASPHYEIVKSSDMGSADAKAMADKQVTSDKVELVPVYPETRGITSRGIRYSVQRLLRLNPVLGEWIPTQVRKEIGIPEIKSAIREIHFPGQIEEALLAQKRFSFEKLFLLQLWNLEARLKLGEKKAPAIGTDIEHLKAILAKLPFVLTASQKQSLWDVIQDIGKPTPMNRLLQGDVGSGKTIVAALSAILAAESGYQTAFMAPTEILVRQHFHTFRGLTQTLRGLTRTNPDGTAVENKPGTSLTIGLVTSTGATIVYADDLSETLKKDRFWKKSAKGEVAIIFGTHALVQKTAAFHNLGLVVIDEQHRFGVNQRKALIRGQAQTETQTNADIKDGKTTDLLYEDLTYKIRGCALALKKNLGLGHKEIIYQKALATELKDAGLAFEREKKISVIYKGEKLGTYQPDFLVEDKIIVELKALPFIGKNELKQTWTYLKGSPYKLALLINFSPTGVDFERIINDTARLASADQRGQDLSEKEGLRLSAQGPRESAAATQGPRESAAALPHFLSMSATPIPRTLTLTVFGDLDLSLITELPAGRKPIETKIVTPPERGAAYTFIRKEIKSGRQAFVICPLISRTNADEAQTDADRRGQETDTGEGLRLSAQGPRESAAAALSPRKSVREDVTSVEAEHEKLSKKIFPDLRVAMLHGQMKSDEKEKVMGDFVAGKTDVLVATSVIEVGVDVSNATIMMIEGTERFGLAQLYQFRGRVGRGGHQSYCFLMSESTGAATRARLQAILKAKNGFELAEYDLKLRGPGEFFGQAQSGFSDTALAAVQNPELVKTSREAAAGILGADPALDHYLPLKQKLAEFEKTIHRE
jgi:ATP-dependent DNA helicase RecG